MQRYYTPNELASHNAPEDCWVAVHGYVYDLTRLLKESDGRLALPLLTAAGTDISHWFDAHTGDVLTRIDPVTNVRTPYCPQGRFVHVPIIEPSSSTCVVETAWWRDAQYQVGALSKRVRLVRVRNLLTQQEHVLEVPSEDTLGEIRRRYLKFNAHAHSYVWKALPLRPGIGGDSVGSTAAIAPAATGKPMGASATAEGDESSTGFSADNVPRADTTAFVELDMNRTLSANGIPDEADEFEDLALPSDYHIPVLHLHFADALTVA